MVARRLENMQDFSRRKLFVVAILIIWIVISIIAVLLNLPAEQKTEDDDSSTSVNESSEKVITNKENGEVGLIASDAVKEYTTQDVKESADARRSRLAPYFTENSPSLNEKLELLNSNIVATESIVVSTELSKESADSIEANIYTSIKNYMNDGSTNYVDRTWIARLNKKDDVWRVYEIK